MAPGADYCFACRLAVRPAIASPPRAAARVADAVPSRSTIARSGGCSRRRRVERCMGPWRTSSPTPYESNSAASSLRSACASSGQCSRPPRAARQLSAWQSASRRRHGPNAGSSPWRSRRGHVSRRFLREKHLSGRDVCHGCRSAIATVPPVCWTSIPSRPDHVLRRHGRYRRSPATSITGLSLGQTERSSHRCRHTRCPNSDEQEQRSWAWRCPRSAWAPTPRSTAARSAARALFPFRSEHRPLLLLFDDWGTLRPCFPTAYVDTRQVSPVESLSSVPTIRRAYRARRR